MRKEESKDKVFLNKPWLEHTNLTHSYRFNGNAIEKPPICNWCTEIVITVKHICVCPNLAMYRDYFLRVEEPHTLKAVVGEAGSSACNF